MSSKAWTFNPIYIELNKKIEELIASSKIPKFEHSPSPPEMSKGIAPQLLKLIRMCEEFVEFKEKGKPQKTSVAKAQLKILLKLGLQEVSTGDFDRYNCILFTFSNEKHVYVDLPAKLIENQFSYFKNFEVTVNIQEYLTKGRKEGIKYTNTHPSYANFTDRGLHLRKVAIPYLAARAES